MWLSAVSTRVLAYDIAAENSDGVTIYYTYSSDGMELVVTNGDGKYSGNIVIPEEITYMNRTRKVTTIGQKAFYECTGLTSITIPESVTRIENRAFQGCSGLTSVSIPKSITSFASGSYAFADCTSLTSAVISEGVTDMAFHMFNNCTKLSSVTIPQSMVKINAGAFYGCTSLTSITIPGYVAQIGVQAFCGCNTLREVNIFDLSAWCRIIFDSADANPLSYAHHLYLNGKEITQLDLPDDITAIGDYLFYSCKALTSILIPDGVTSIGNCAFYGCSGLTSVVIPPNVTSIGGGAFAYCSGLTSITIPPLVSHIEGNVFNGIDLTSVTALMKEPRAIYGKDNSQSTFSANTYNNAKLYVPGGCAENYKAKNGWKDFLFIESIDDTYFTSGDYSYEILTAEDGSLTDEVKLTGLRSGWQFTAEKTTMTIPDEVVYKGTTYKVVEYTCFDCPVVWKTVVLGKNIRKIPVNTEFKCENYEVAEGSKYFKGINGILYSADGKTLILCSNYHYPSGTDTREEGVHIPDSVEVIGSYSFSGNNILHEKLHLPKSLKVIETSAFNHYRNMPNHIDFPSGLERIDNYAFYEDYTIHSIVLHEGIKRLGSNTFYGTKFKELTLPESVDSIMDVWGWATYMDTLTCLGKVPPKIGDKEAFKHCVEYYFNEESTLHKETILKVPGGCREVYANDECWGTFKWILETGDQIAQCAAPTIQYVDGKLLCTSATDGAKCVTTILAPDTGTYEEGEIPLQGTYKISAYAKKHGFTDSDLVTATLYWIEKELKPDGMDAGAIQANARPVIVSSTGNTLTVQGAEDGESITAYALDGKLLGTAVSRNGQASLPLSTTQTEIVIIKVGDKAIKARVR